jgi:hypothetical protein
MSYRYDVSYPFFDVAKRHGIDYGDVLRAAQFLEHVDGGGRFPGPLLPDEVCEERVPLDAMMEIAELVDLPVYARGGRTDFCESIVCGSSARWSEPLICIGMGPGCAVRERGEVTR